VVWSPLLDSHWTSLLHVLVLSLHKHSNTLGIACWIITYYPRYCYSKYKYHCYSETFMNHWYMYTILHVPQRFLIHVPPIYRYTNSLDTVISYIGIIIIWILGTQLYHVHTSLLHMFTAPVYIHVLCLYSCHMDHRSYYMYYYAMLSMYSCYMIIARYWY